MCDECFFVAKPDCVLLRVMCVVSAREGGTQMAEKDTPPHFLNARTQENTVCVCFSPALFGCCACMLVRSNGATLHYDTAVLVYVKRSMDSV